MKNIAKNINRALKSASNIKKSKKAIVWLIALDLIMGVTSNIVDWNWLMSVDWYLRPFAPICSLFPLTLAIWLIIYRIKGKVPAWFTSFIFIGITSYGLMAILYFPIYMKVVAGFKWMIVGNLLWVITYAVQSIIIYSEINLIKTYKFILIMSYFLFKDYSDRYLGSFIDTLQPSFPNWLKDFLGITITSIHIMLFVVIYKIMKRKKQVS